MLGVGMKWQPNFKHLKTHLKTSYTQDKLTEMHWQQYIKIALILKSKNPNSLTCGEFYKFRNPPTACLPAC